MMQNEIFQLAARLGEALLKEGARATTAESCTGGGVANALTSVPGSSQWFEYGFVTYANRAKEQVLGVSSVSLERYGAVSKQVVREMAEGAIHASLADYAVAISGVAGPDGGTPEKPVGTVWFAFAGRDGITCEKHVLEGDRQAIREQAVKISLQQLLHQVTG